MEETVDIVIGANGFIGSYIYRYIKRKGRRVIGTSHIGSGNTSDSIHLDLANPDLSFLNSIKNIGYVYCCARIGTIDQCKQDPFGTARVNIDGLLAVLDALKHTSGVPVFFSGNMVFPGTREDYNEHDQTDPTTEYGKQKAEVERAIQEMFERFFIIRLTKVYGVTRGDNTLFTAWLDSWANNIPVRAVTDITVAPVYVGDIVETLWFLLENSGNGIWHFPGTQADTIYNFAKRLADYFHIEPALLISATQSDFNWLEKRSPYNTLSSTMMPLISRKQFTLDRAFEQLRAQYPSFEQRGV